MTYFAFTQKYSTEQAYIKLHLEGLKCPYCGRKKSRLHMATTRPRMVHCNKCRREFSIFRKKSIARNTKIDLRKWGYVLNFVNKHEPNITARKLMGKIKVTYKTAWRMLTLIRTKNSKKGGSKES